MPSIPEKQLFCWRDIENLDDLKRLRLVLENLPDERLMSLLEEQRGSERDDYPVRAVWNSILAAVVFEHEMKAVDAQAHTSSPAPQTAYTEAGRVFQCRQRL